MARRLSYFLWLENQPRVKYIQNSGVLAIFNVKSFNMIYGKWKKFVCACACACACICLKFLALAEKLWKM